MRPPVIIIKLSYWAWVTFGLWNKILLANRKLKLFVGKRINNFVYCRSYYVYGFQWLHVKLRLSDFCSIIGATQFYFHRLTSIAYRRLFLTASHRTFQVFPRSEITGAQRSTVRLEYLPGELRGLRNPSKRTPIDQSVFQRLRDCGVLKHFRGCRAGRAVKSRKQAGSVNIRPADPRRANLQTEFVTLTDTLCHTSSSRSSFRLPGKEGIRPFSRAS